VNEFFKNLFKERCWDANCKKIATHIVKKGNYDKDNPNKYCEEHANMFKGDNWIVLPFSKNNEGKE